MSSWNILSQQIKLQTLLLAVWSCYNYSYELLFNRVICSGSLKKKKLSSLSFPYSKTSTNIWVSYQKAT